VGEIIQSEPKRILKCRLILKLKNICRSNYIFVIICRWRLLKWVHSVSCRSTRRTSGDRNPLRLWSGQLDQEVGHREQHQLPLVQQHLSLFITCGNYFKIIFKFRFNSFLVAKIRHLLLQNIWSLELIFLCQLFQTSKMDNSVLVVKFVKWTIVLCFRQLFGCE